MKDYTFEMTLKVSISVGAESREEAERIVSEPFADGAFIRVWEHDPYDVDAYNEHWELEGECSLVGSVELTGVD